MKKSELENIMGCTVFIGNEEIDPFCRYAAAVKSGAIVEIGAGLGSSATLFLGFSNPAIEVHSIDPFVGDSEGGWVSSEDQCRGNVTRALSIMGLPFAFARWQLHVMTSHSMSIQWQSRIELLYLDGNHKYDFVRQDFEDWFPMVQLGGLIFIHDSLRALNAIPGQFDHGWEGPTRLAKELQDDSRVRFIESFFSTTVYRKAT